MRTLHHRRPLRPPTRRSEFRRRAFDDRRDAAAALHPLSYRRRGCDARRLPHDRGPGRGRASGAARASAPTPARPVRPTAGSIRSPGAARPPPSETTAMPERAAIDAPRRSRASARMSSTTGATGRWRSGSSREIGGTAERRDHFRRTARRRCSPARFLSQKPGLNPVAKTPASVTVTSRSRALR